MQQLLGLSGLLQAAVLGAERKAAELSASMPEEARSHGTAGPSWMSADDCRAAWQQIAEVGCKWPSKGLSKSAAGDILPHPQLPRWQVAIVAGAQFGGRNGSDMYQLTTSTKQGRYHRLARVVIDESLGRLRILVQTAEDLGRNSACG